MPLNPDDFSFIPGIFGGAPVKPGKPKTGEVGGLTSFVPLPGAVAIPGTFGGSFLGGGVGFGGLGQGVGGLTGMLGTAFPGLNIGFYGGLCSTGVGTGWGSPAQIYQVYRMMSLFPMFRLIRTACITPIITSQWTIKAAEGIDVAQAGDEFKIDQITGRVKAAPQFAIDDISAQLLPLRRDLVTEGTRYCEFGMRPFQRVYDLRKMGKDGSRRYVLQKMKPILPDVSQILVDYQGNFSGLQTSVSGSMSPDKCWIATWDGEAGNLYGLARHAAAKQAWIAWNYAQIRAAMLQSKLSGNLVIVYYRPGQTPITFDANNQPLKYANNGDIAKQISATLFCGEAVAVPTTEYDDSQLQSNPELAKLAPWKIEVVDAGSYAPAIDGIIREREYLEKQFIRAWGWPERALIEGQHGTKAEAGVHEDMGSADRELIDDDFANQVSQGQRNYNVPGIIDELLRLNYGEETIGSIVCKPAPLVDDKVQVYTTLFQALIEAAAKDPDLGTILAEIDWGDVVGHLDIATVKGKDGINSVVQAAVAAKQKTAADAQKQQSDQIQEATGAASTNRIGMSGVNGKKKAAMEN